jgi:hypothetical protein
VQLAQQSIQPWLTPRGRPRGPSGGSRTERGAFGSETGAPLACCYLALPVCMPPQVPALVLVCLLGCTSYWDTHSANAPPTGGTHSSSRTCAAVVARARDVAAFLLLL